MFDEPLNNIYLSPPHVYNCLSLCTKGVVSFGEGRRDCGFQKQVVWFLVFRLSDGEKETKEQLHY